MSENHHTYYFRRFAVSSNGRDATDMIEISDVAPADEPFASVTQHTFHRGLLLKVMQDLEARGFMVRLNLSEAYYQKRGDKHAPVR